MILPANPKAGYISHKKEFDEAIMEVMDSGWYILGSKVKAFEENFAKYLNTGHCIGVASGTDAVHFALRICGVHAGDYVITVSHTAVATVSAIDWIGATPVLVDIDADTFTIDPQKVIDTIKLYSKNKIKVLIPVHLYGHPAKMNEMKEIAGDYDLKIVEDCAQAHGSMVDGKYAGSIGDCGAFSFYPTKNLGAFGDAGAVVTNNDDLADKLRMLQQYGWKHRYISEDWGYNSRLDEIQAAILLTKLNWLEENNRRRRKIAEKYNQGLSDLPIELPIENEGYYHTYHQYVVKCDNREALRKYLKKNNIMTSILYPVPIHRQKGYKNRIKLGAGGLSISEDISAKILCLPIYPELEDQQIDFVLDHIRNYFSGKIV